MDVNMPFSETKIFYSTLDECIKDGDHITLTFPKGFPPKNSGLWKRLSNTANWQSERQRLPEVNDDLVRYVDTHQSIAQSVVPMNPYLFAFIATLISSVLFFAIYKGRKIRFIITKDGLELVIE